MIRFVMGLALALATLVGAYVLEGGWIFPLLALTPFLITFFVPLFAVLAVWSFREWMQAWGHSFRQTSAQGTDVSVEIWKFSEVASYLADLLSLLTGGILILGSFGSAQVSWNHALGAALVGPTYGTLFGLISRILRARVQSLQK